MKGKKWETLAVYVFYFLVFMLFVIPIYWAVLISIKPRTEMFTASPSWITLHPTLKNYIHVLLNTRIPIAFRNSIILSASSVLLSVGLSTSAAYGFSRFHFKGSTAILLGLIVSRMLPISILIVPIYVMINAMGMYDTFQGVIMVYTGLNIPFSIWIMKGFYDSIPRELDDAGLIDGCNNFQIFARIVFPLTKPGIIAVSIFAFFTCWNEFILSLVLTSSEKIKPISQALYGFISEQGVNWGNMMASASLAMIPPALLFLIFQKQFISGITGGAVKG
jgi:ABC-type glycerol-3-phosphate transport system permease component